MTTKITNKASVLAEFSRLFTLEMKRIAETVNQADVDNDQIKRDAIRQVKATFDTEEMLDALLDSSADTKMKAVAKAHGVSAILANNGEDTLFPIGLDSAVISLNGATNGFRSASDALISRQEREWIMTAQKVTTSTGRNLATTGPVRALMQENSLTAGEALDVLRKREEEA